MLRVEADISNFAKGEILSIKCEDEKWRLVTFISKSLTNEKNYKIYNKEILAIVKCLKALRNFMKEAKSKFEIWTDHRNLESFIKVQKLN